MAMLQWQFRLLLVYHSMRWQRQGQAWPSLDKVPIATLVVLARSHAPGGAGLGSLKATNTHDCMITHNK